MLLTEKFKDFKIILASESPRRKMLLHDMGLKFEVAASNIDESKFDITLSPQEVTMFLAEKKALTIGRLLNTNIIIIAADTIVFLNNEIVGKPIDSEDAIAIISKLSGKKHVVITGVCIMSSTKTKTFFVSTDVYFRELTFEEITYYVESFKPYDKAGAYGIQEWVGLIGLKKIDGSYHNVMGLPTAELYTELMHF